MTIDPKQAHLWIVGGGIAGMASAAFAIRDAGVPGQNVHILEELQVSGGAMDGSKSPFVTDGLVTRGGRMFENKAYQTAWDLFSSIPSLDDPEVSVRQEIIDFTALIPTQSKARLIDGKHGILDHSTYGLNTRDRFEMSCLVGLPENVLGARRIDEMFSDHFFQTNFWQMWRTIFAFQKWHSAAEMRRYMRRFIHEFDSLNTLSWICHTKYNQYDSVIVPLQRWLVAQGADVRFGTRVTDVDFTQPGEPRRATALHIEDSKGISTIDLGSNDYAFMTIGSITADTTYGSNDTVPPLVRNRLDHGWSLWEQIAKKADDFGRPNTFFGNIDENKWESFTLTMHNDTLIKRIAEYTGNKPGTGGIMTWIESGWHLSIAVQAKPHFYNQPENTYTLWGYGFEIDNEGDYVKKRMSQATGKEILTELVHQMGFDDILDEVLATTDVTTVMIPYASALFSRRLPQDRPKVIPDGSQNFAFLGQFTELPSDVVFTVEYSVHGAMHAVYTLLGVDREIPSIYQGLRDPKVAAKAVQAAYK